MCVCGCVGGGLWGSHTHTDLLVESGQRDALDGELDGADDDLLTHTLAVGDLLATLRYNYKHTDTDTDLLWCVVLPSSLFPSLSSSLPHRQTD